MNDTPKRVIPSLGTTGHEIYNAWRELPTGYGPRQVVEAIVPFVGVFAFNVDGEMQLVEHLPACQDCGNGVISQDVGYFSTYREPTIEESEGLHEAIDRGWIQIESRKIWGAFGLFRLHDAGALVKVHHQATGKPLAEWLETEKGQKWAAKEAREDAEIAAKYART